MNERGDETWKELKAVVLEEMNFYKSESQFIGDYRVLLDGDKVVWIAEHGLP